MDRPPPPAGIEIHEHAPLARHTYMRIGGPAEYFATPADLVELERLMLWARAAAMPMRIIGGGSNLLVADEGVSGLVVSLRRACGGIEFTGSRVTAGAAVMLPALARAAAERGLGGLEFAVGIPGSVGGALQTNAGIGDGRCIGPLVREVEVFGGRGFQTLSRYEIHFDYRHSSLRGAGVMVVGATLHLEPRPTAEIQAEMRQLLEARSASQPTAEPNAGSMFRNPEGNAAGRLIEAAGCKGLASGGVRVSELHANFFVHDGSGRASDVLALMSEVQRRVLETSGVWLTPEIVWWGDGAPPAPFAGAPEG
ncbi:MAG: UDP-N-acetylmuramate dehydrogenase [Dehalococcoidia bacterium]|nr:UDP-N-acetylmuramate dehydrogenase [Dehalococcoidia bacterium]